MLKPKKRRGGDEQLQRLRARDDAAMSAMSARGERDTSRSMISHGGTDGGTSCCLSSSSEQCDKSIPEFQAFEKSLECLAQHWEKVTLSPFLVCFWLSSAPPRSLNR